MYSQVYEEIVHVLGDDIGQCPTYEDLMKLEYLDRVIRECLRMYPAAPIIGRQVTQDIKVTTEEGKEYIFPTGRYEFFFDIGCHFNINDNVPSLPTFTILNTLHIM